jgi:membrane protein insertase Oxa1/YidC/SpoIIIJ
LLARALLLPISFTSAYRMEKNERKQRAVKPQLDRLKEQLKDDPRAPMKHAMNLCRDNGIRFF